MPRSSVNSSTSHVYGGFLQIVIRTRRRARNAIPVIPQPSNPKFGYACPHVEHSISAGRSGAVTPRRHTEQKLATKQSGLGGLSVSQSVLREFPRSRAGRRGPRTGNGVTA